MCYYLQMLEPNCQPCDVRCGVWIRPQALEGLQQQIRMETVVLRHAVQLLIRGTAGVT